jgi:hypothetical protein
MTHRLIIPYFRPYVAFQWCLEMPALATAECLADALVMPGGTMRLTNRTVAGLALAAGKGDRIHFDAALVIGSGAAPVTACCGAGSFNTDMPGSCAVIWSVRPRRSAPSVRERPHESFSPKSLWAKTRRWHAMIGAAVTA